MSETGPFRTSCALKLLSNILLTEETNFDFFDRNLAKVIAERSSLDSKRNRQLYQILYTLKVLHEKDPYAETRLLLKP